MGDISLTTKLITVLFTLLNAVILAAILIAGAYGFYRLVKVMKRGRL